MKTIDIKWLLIASFALMFMGCDDNMGDTDSRLAEVTSLVEPADGKSVVLESSASSSLYFEWEAVSADEAGTLLYRLAFDTVDGDFSNPVYTTYSDNNGYRNYATITHERLNDIAGKIGIKSSETGTFKWTVFSSKGTESVKSDKEYNLTVTRLAGFDVIPVDVYVTGAGSEGGTTLADAHRMRSLASGQFEVYTKLKAGEPFYFVDGTSGTPTEYYTADGLIKEREEDETTTVSTEGIYCISLNFNTGACSYTLVNRLGFYYCNDDEILFDLNYDGYGVFSAKETVTLVVQSWGNENRYKFRMFIQENGGADEEEEVEWGTMNQTDSAPNSSSPDSYYYMTMITGSSISQWDNKWKIMDDFNGVEATYTVYLTADVEEYTHSITK